MHIPGDFHFLWECLRVIFLTFWGTPAEHGSLCNVREQIRRNQVDKDVKVFSVGDEFVIHSFKAHLTARVYTTLGLHSTSDTIPHEKIPCMASINSREASHRDFDAYAYPIQWHTLQHAQDAPSYRFFICGSTTCHQIWEWATYCKTVEAMATKTDWNWAEELCCWVPKLPKYLSFIATHNRTVNMEGKTGRGKPLDQMIEHYNL